MSAATRRALADRYLRRLREAARALPRAHQLELLAEIEAHIAAGLDGAGTDEAVRTLLDDLGEPEEIVAAALPAPPLPRRGRAALALGLVAAPLSLIPFYGWVVSIPLGVGAIVMGIGARRHARSRGTPDSAATGGLLAGAVAVAVPLLVVALFLPWGTVTEAELVPESEFQVNPDPASGPPQPSPPPPSPEQPASP